MAENIKDRTKKLAVDIIRFCEKFAKETKYFVIEKQIMRSATSVGANYRAACRARSKAEFIAKLGIVEEEADETLYWFEIILELKSEYEEEIRPLYKEMQEILAIIISSKKTARSRK
ncbi:four helix bundle protein [Treponema sp. OMZ 840]|uniref:four helix bundle protein n=1 Tax=Treponema sp. OMZ 840 TaxID=244313 RepID=UPI003D930D8C